MIEKITELIFKTPEKWVHIREIGRKLKVSPNSVRKYAARLKKEGIVEKKREGNMIRIRANLDDEKYRHEKMIYNLRCIYDSGITEFLFEHYHPEAIVLFGSYSRGEDISTSDVDIGVLTKNKKRHDLSIFEKKISRKIELSLFSKKEVSNEFFNNIINGIVLKGFLK